MKRNCWKNMAETSTEENNPQGKAGKTKGKVGKNEEEEEEKPQLLKIGELHPSPFSKKVILFDVYETDEENFEPYISPLATVGEISSSSSSASSSDSSSSSSSGDSSSDSSSSDDSSSSSSSDSSSSGGSSKKKKKKTNKYYTPVAKVLQTYYISNNWNSFINRVRFCTTKQAVRNIIKGHKKRKGMQIISDEFIATLIWNIIKEG